MDLEPIAFHGSLFGDPVVATTRRGRLLHHAIVVQIEGASYRLRAHADLIPKHTGSHAAKFEDRSARSPVKTAA